MDEDLPLLTFQGEDLHKDFVDYSGPRKGPGGKM